jgi:hypothetical protein
MGQAKQRSAEIAALKAAGAKAKNTQRHIVGFGAYYKDLDDDGVSIQFMTFKDPKPGFTKFIYKAVQDCVDKDHEELAAGRLTVPEIWEQLHTAIVAFNFKCFGTNIRPKQTDYQIDLLKSMAEVIVIMNNIWTLTELGEIKNDNYNGMNFMYSEDLVESVA